MPLTREEIIQLRELLVGWSNNAMQLVTIRHSRASSSISASLYPRVEKIWLEHTCILAQVAQGRSKGESRLADEWSENATKLLLSTLDWGIERRDWSTIEDTQGPLMLRTNGWTVGNYAGILYDVALDRR